ncbi:hypothetical protein Pla110_32410 [Polystyrenella longa]|uniref:Uncharacterized protein n=1 Tax=Polystyrenella longa TaxID=2528007 RepID=A0A518CQJ4_9PLAN|nr:hypothetical protein [Polystyrenella longa]QDU81499.1 hypothetical protein Pla110_32410 [Polystyrenella longa]
MAEFSKLNSRKKVTPVAVLLIVIVVILLIVGGFHRHQVRSRYLRHGSETKFIETERVVPSWMETLGVASWLPETMFQKPRSVFS